MLVQLEVLVVRHELQDPALTAQPQSSTNQLALSPGSPLRPSNSGNKVRFVLGVISPDSYIAFKCYSFVCVEAKVVS